MTHRILLLTCLVFSLFAAGCFVDLVDGPSSGLPLATLTYTLHIHGGPCAISAGWVRGPAALIAEIPVDWQLERASFSATLLEGPVSAEAIVAPYGPIWLPSSPQPGFKRLCVSTPSAYSMSPNDEGTVRITFRAGPTLGTFPLRFSAGARSDLSGDMCAQQVPTEFPVTIRLDAEPPAIPALSIRGLCAFGGLLLWLGLWRVRSLGPGA